MEPPVRDVHALPVIKCSSCDEDVDMMAMGDHTCSTTTQAATVPPTLPRTRSFSSLRQQQQSRRPPLPKIDPSAACMSIPLIHCCAHRIDIDLVRPPVWRGELTPASSGHSSLVSPASATSSSRPPWPSSRKGSMPEVRRPPSPELTNLDCAFPPFPLPSKTATTRKRDRAASQRSATHRSRSKDTPTSVRADNLSRKGSANDSLQSTSEGRLVGKRSRPSTPSSRNGSVSTRSDSRQQSVDTVPQAHIQPIDELATVPILEVDPPIESSKPSLLARTFPEPLPLRSPSIDPGLSAFDFGTTEITPSPPTKPNNEVISNASEIEDKTRSETHPSYKAKRPPPLAAQQSEPIINRTKSPISPQPPSAGVFATTFGKLFGRRPSNSRNPSREVVRQALSDEPETYEEGAERSYLLSPDSEKEQSYLLSPDSDKNFLSAEPSPISSNPGISPQPSPLHEESLKALEGVIPAPAAIPVVVIEPIPEMESSETAVVTQPDEPLRFPRISRIVEEPPSFISETSTRDSIDSASSYGSIGFSERTTSSSSSSSQPELLPSKQLSNSSVADMPAPLRPRIPALSPDSPTDPNLRHGRLSPIPDMPGVPNVPTDSLQPLCFDFDVTPTPPPAPVLARASTEPDTSTARKPKYARPNKGVCRGCSQVILASQKSVSSADGLLTGRYHKECFVCRTCKVIFPTAEFYVHDDKPYCAQHYHEVANSLCATCGKGIEGLYMETANVAGRGKEKHHPECLKCTTCRIRLDHDYFELSGKVYCERDAFRLASVPKARENAPSRPSPLVREYISSGQDGLVKGRNFPERRTTRLLAMTKT
ncbi:hypothetical protein, variant 1 [Exophiala sideris]|uniref:LIM zinc-binding domain-containing protein n=1 Tax=Exophiala sideris TaxID=1016849 RepID=A0A0D1YBP1_9EURO|nr:hypothetical protein, variant 1 [Exophiala sideris]